MYNFFLSFKIIKEEVTKMKKIFLGLLVIGLLFMGCDTTVNSGSNKANSESEKEFSSGWWKFASNIEGSQSTFIKYASDKSIVRAGTTIEEYQSGYLNNIKANLAFDLLKDSSSFTKISDEHLLPSWATDEISTEPSEPEEKCTIFFDPNFPSPYNYPCGYYYNYVTDLNKKEKGRIPDIITVSKNSYVNLSYYFTDYGLSNKGCEVWVTFGNQKEFYFFELESFNTKEDGTGVSYKYNIDTIQDLYVTENISLYGIWKPSTKHDSTLLGGWYNDKLAGFYNKPLEFYIDGSVYFCFFKEGQFASVFNGIGQWEISVNENGTKKLIIIDHNRNKTIHDYMLSEDLSLLTTSGDKFYWDAPDFISWERRN